MPCLAIMGRCASLCEFCIIHAPGRPPLTAGPLSGPKAPNICYGVHERNPVTCLQFRRPQMFGLRCSTPNGCPTGGPCLPLGGLVPPPLAFWTSLLSPGFLLSNTLSLCLLVHPFSSSDPLHLCDWTSPPAPPPR